MPQNEDEERDQEDHDPVCLSVRLSARYTAVEGNLFSLIYRDQNDAHQARAINYTLYDAMPIPYLYQQNTTAHVV